MADLAAPGRLAVEARLLISLGTLWPGSGFSSGLSGHSLARLWVQFWPLQEPLWTCSRQLPGYVVALRRLF